MSDLNIPLHITEQRAESHDCLSLFFKRPAGVSYEPGDWMDIRFPTPEFPVGRTYSFASSPTEPDLRITFKHGISPFKQQLQRATPGARMLITQYGTNGFRLDRRYPAVFIAGGVGITPFRSMIKELVDTGIDAEIELVYQNRTEDLPFRQELDAWSHAHPWLKVHFVATGSQGRLTKQTFQGLLPDLVERQARHYIAGPPGMADRMERILHALGLDAEDIKTDRFDGY